MERYLAIVKTNWKYNLFPHVMIASLFCIVAPALMGLENLNQFQTAQVLEVYMSLLGIVLCVPLFIPDQDKNIKDLLESKKEPMIKIHIIRLFQAVICLCIFIALFMLRLRYGGCVFEFGKYFLGTIISALFLGGLGILAYSLIDNIAVAYMIPILYYILCYGAGKKLGKFFLFSMMKGSYEEKKYLAVTAIIMIILGIVYRNVKKRWS